MRTRFQALAFAAFFASVAAAWFLAPISARADVNVDHSGLAIQGYDPVAYFMLGKPTPGDPGITATRDGATYRFASARHRELFGADPEKYIPVYGGFCAYGVSQGYKVKIDPAAFRIVENKLYLNYDLSVRKTWSLDIPGYIRAANENWRSLKDK